MNQLAAGTLGSRRASLFFKPFYHTAEDFFGTAPTYAQASPRTPERARLLLLSGKGHPPKPKFDIQVFPRININVQA